MLTRILIVLIIIAVVVEMVRESVGRRKSFSKNANRLTAREREFAQHRLKSSKWAD